MSVPVYLALETGDLLDACRQAFATASPVETTVDDLLAQDDAEAGLVLVSADTARPGHAASRLQDRDEAWTVAVVEEGAEGPRIQAVSRSWDGALEETARAWLADERPGALLEIRGTLREIARARHDINNPLTSALAETQLLLMDVTDEEVREALDVVQAQLRRIRDLVADTGHLRPPRR